MNNTIEHKLEHEREITLNCLYELQREKQEILNTLFQSMGDFSLPFNRIQYLYDKIIYHLEYKERDLYFLIKQNEKQPFIDAINICENKQDELSSDMLQTYFDKDNISAFTVIHPSFCDYFLNRIIKRLKQNL